MEKESLAGELQIHNVNKWYPGKVHAVIDMNMEINQGEFIVFVGPSGCGKTTLLRMIAGLETISGGEVIMDGRVVNKVPPKNRDIAMVFQNYALYPNMKVKDNIAFPLKMRHTGKQETKSRVAEVARKLELDTLLERKPGALSGGQRQRVALARSMVRKPKLFLMDEPLANLDARLRTEMRREIITLQRELNHDFLLIQLCLDPLRIHLLDSGIPGHGIGNHSRLPSRQGNNRVSQRLDCHGAEGHRHLLPGGQQHIHLPVGSKGIDLICLLNQLVGGIPLGRQHRHYLVAGLICIRDDFSHMAQPGGVSHRGSSEFLYN